MPDSFTKPVPIPRASESRYWSGVAPEQALLGDEKAPQQEVGVQHASEKCRPRSRMTEDLELGIAEIQRIMQGNTNSKQCHVKTLKCFCGVSPPTRSTGAANPLGMDTAWRNTAYKACTFSNLQALREMNDSAVLHSNVYGDVLTLPDSPPDLGLLSADFDGIEDLDDRRTSPASDSTRY